MEKKLLQTVFESEEGSFTPENIRSGFWWTGLIPLDLIIRHKLNIPSAPEAKSTATSTTSTSSTHLISTSTPDRLLGCSHGIHNSDSSKC